MAKKKNIIIKMGLAEWMGTFSDLMTLLMCFFVMLFAMSNTDEEKFDQVAQSFKSTISIFQGGAQAIGDGLLVSNGVSQLNMLDEYVNTTGKMAESDTDETDFEENAQESEKSSSDGTESSEEYEGISKEDLTGQGQTETEELAEKIGGTIEEAEELESAIDTLEGEKLAVSEALAEKVEEAIEENFIESDVGVSFDANCVVLTLSGAFLFDSGDATIKTEAEPVLKKVGLILSKYADSTIEIEGHTDSVPLNGGKYENNDVLSSYRALAVFNYLKDNCSIDPGVMKHTGRGEYVPLADNSTPEGRAKNRRVEIKIYNALSGY